MRGFKQTPSVARKVVRLHLPAEAEQQRDPRQLWMDQMVQEEQM